MSFDMRVVPLISATLVLIALYLFVMERDLLMSWAGIERSPEPDTAPAAVTGVLSHEDDGPFQVVVERIVEQDLESAIILRGRTAASRSVEVRAETTGPVVSTPRPRGTRVATGETLCELDPGTRAASLAEAQARRTEAQARLDEARARLDELETAYDRATQLAAEGLASQSSLDSARAGLQSARASVQSAHAGIEGSNAAVAAAEAELARLTITAPFAGVLEANSAETGSLLSAGGLCATIIQLDPMLVVGFAAESQIDRLAVGALAGARLSNGTESVGRVTFLSRSADPATRTFRVEVTVDNGDLAIRDGMSADLLIAATATRGHLVPGSALTINDTGDLGLRLVDENSHTVFAPVTVLRDAPQGFWVAGLPQTADVIVVGHEYVTDGIEVRVARRGSEQGE